MSARKDKSIERRWFKGGKSKAAPSATPIFKGRVLGFGVLLSLVAMALAARAFELQIFKHDFLTRQGDARQLRVVRIPASRGVILDRNDHPLAVSTPVESVWVKPADLLDVDAGVERLCKVLHINADDTQRRLLQHQDKEFIYLQRRVKPRLARQVRELDLPGVGLIREHKRYYPTAEVSAQVIGFTNVDDIGQEGLELAYDDWLRGTPGRKRVLKDNLGHVVRDVELVDEARPGRDLRLSLDTRLQYLAYRELQASVHSYQAKSGSVVIMDVATGQILAMVNQPASNPNQRSSYSSATQRNRAVTDVIEPGSVIKPFTVAVALAEGKVTPATLIDTSPGTLHVADVTVHDAHDFGLISVTQILSRSSNVGATRLAMAVGPKALWTGFRRVGFGDVTGSAFPGESPGVLQNYQRWHASRGVTVAYGYGLSVTPLQLAQAYAAIANGGVLRTPTFRTDSDNVARRVLPAAVADELKQMLEKVVAPGATGKRAAIANYRIAGKTGTARKSGSEGYSDRYVATFAGFGPVSRPRLVVVAVINDPAGDAYYGGQVAAPLFQRVMSGALRLLNIPPDAIPGGNYLVTTHAQHPAGV